MTSQPDQLSHPPTTGEHARPTPSHRAEAPPVSDEMDAAMEAAMSVPQEVRPKAAHGTHPGHTAQEGHRPAAIRGPRVVQAGREMRPGTVVSVGPTDVFIEFGPKELGVVSRLQWPEGEAVPEPKQVIEVVVDRRDDDGLLLCSRPGSVRKADW